MMTTSPEGRAFLEKEEGCVLFPYHDAAGIETIGVGHRILSGEDYGHGISQAQCDALLANDLRLTEACVNSRVHATIGQHQFDAMVSLTYNIGTGAFIGSSVLRLTNSGDYQAAADAFRLWSHITVGGHLVVSPQLLARRERERAVFLLDVDAA